jgi:hypothetical protein
MNNAITFAKLRDLLCRLGFSETVVPKSHILFEHAGGREKLFFRLYTPSEKLDPGDVLKTRRFLDEWGLLERDEFERLLHEPAA